MSGCDLVHHLATVRTGTSVDRLADDPRTRAGYEADVDATRVVVDCAVECRVGHFVYTSSAGVHGRIRRVPADESEPLAPDTAHRKAKLDGEEIVRGASERHGLPSVMARLSSVYGPGDERAGRFFRMIPEGRFQLVGSGDIPYHYTYIDDIVLGLRRCEGWRGEAGRAFLIGADPIPTLREFMEAIADESGVPLRRSPVPLAVFRTAAGLSRAVLVPLGIRPAVIRNLEFFTLPRAYDVTRAREELGFRSRVGIREGVARTLAWMRTEGARPARARAAGAD
jgi:nucleoside-diphosphate-sugar epimerase